MTSDQYINGIRAECIDLMGCAEMDDSLDRLRDSVFYSLVSQRFHKQPLPTCRQVAEEWVAIVQNTPEHLKLDRVKRPPVNRLQFHLRP